METRSASSILQMGAIDVITDLPTALTFDDVLLVPRHSTVVPSQVDVTTRFTRNIQLNVPLASAADAGCTPCDASAIRRALTSYALVQLVIFAVVELLILPFAANAFLAHEPMVAAAWMAPRKPVPYSDRYT